MFLNRIKKSSLQIVLNKVWHESAHRDGYMYMYNAKIGFLRHLGFFYGPEHAVYTFRWNRPYDLAIVNAPHTLYKSYMYMNL